jgi:aspartyl-tRNA(Asn)/glutamyl-tRNA(Gln) amidotransferase subunit A
MPMPDPFATIRTLAKQLRAKEFTAVELAEFFLDRVERLGPKLNAVVTVTRKLALEQAQQADRELAAGKDRGPLHGIPYGAKDLLATAGIPTTWGAKPYRDQVFHEDATVVRRLREAGAVLVAKLAMVEIAGGLGYEQADAAFTGPGLNPWDTRAWSGGSSSGSAAAVAAGLVPFSIGSETSGSIVTPAVYCGVTGLRPTYGRVSRHGAMALSWSLDKLGPFGRTADDCGLVLAAIAGADSDDPTAADKQYVYPPPVAELPGVPMRIALLRGAASNGQPAVKANFEKSLELLRPHAEFTEIELPDLPYGHVIGTIIDCEMAAAFESLVTSGEVWQMAAPEDRIGLHAQLVIPAKDYINALRIRRVIQKAIDKLLEPYDALIVPGRNTVAGPIDTSFRVYGRGYRSPPIGTAENAAGIPAICIPNGFGERGLPTGLQIIGRAWDENRILAIAKRMQDATNWHEKQPPGF